MPNPNQEILGAIAALVVKVDTLQASMDEDKSIQQICWHCGGDGNKAIGVGEVGTCPDCDGTGVNPFARITKRTEE